MIQFTLKCGNGHRFDSWFASSGAYETIRAAGHLGCPDCGDTTIAKAPMAPRLAAAGGAPSDGAETGERDASVLAARAPAAAADPGGPETEARRIRAALDRLRRQIESISEDVGAAFARQARAMHLGEIPARTIRGSTTPEEKRALDEDEVPVFRIPVLPPDRRN